MENRKRRLTIISVLAVSVLLLGYIALIIILNLRTAGRVPYNPARGWRFEDTEEGYYSTGTAKPFIKNNAVCDFIYNAKDIDVNIHIRGTYGVLFQKEVYLFFEDTGHGGTIGEGVPLDDEMKVRTENIRTAKEKELYNRYKSKVDFAIEEYKAKFPY